MKVVGINGSPHKEGNTARLIQTVFNELNRQGIDTEMISLSSQNISGCTACGACMKQKNRHCVITDDSFNVYLEKMIAADGIILGSPVYSADVTSQIKAFIDRASMVLAANKGLLKYKVGASVIAARRGGAISAFDTLNHFLHSKEMFLVGSTYWNMVYGNQIGEVEQDQEGMANMKNLGENMAWLLKKIHSNAEFS
ncbi:multimeric flavodoxin WrbA [Sporomusaceae bacterium BoRhaA]|uniref:flavodoxin family protein n=1 Tax=Pelorhabdus rhamnosifermentans TaxID=2772457 RepID=UPI001C0609D1|nr:flavodoxin family protein [Pelorhabdus rhamnosifermentans]MBU2699993.1 multimeric flavodoxin WrbA [Pelorhabdus rhamnosifermentans]